MKINDSAEDLLAPFDSDTVATVIRRHSTNQPARPAIVMQNGVALTYLDLAEQVAAFGARLRAAGIGPPNRVAIVLPDVPELGVAIVGTVCHAVAVPLDPTLTPAELDGIFGTLHVDAVIVPDWLQSAVPRVAVRHGIAVLQATRRHPGTIDISAREPNKVAGAARPALERGVDADGVAIVLRTSGTTAQPKFVPVTHRDLITIANRLRKWFVLTPDDRALCTLPLYYGQGIQNALFTPLLLGGSVAVPGGTIGGDALSWLADLEPTWYSAGPAFHRFLLDRALAQNQVPLRHSLRFIQSAGAHLPAAVSDGLEEIFGIPVLEGYGLSETGLIAANGVRPGHRKRGTVGKPWGNQLTVRGEDGRLLASGMIGEVAVYGPGVMSDYLGDREVGAAAFVDGWFRTGDLGSIDSDGFVSLSGRIKELINRGGEKIAPPEIDEALLRHPAVAQAAAFPVQHPRLGEDVSAAVVLRSGASSTEAELRRHLRELLAPFKVPRRIHILDALPRTATGKVRRAELTLMFARPEEHTPVLPDTILEIQIAEIWSRILGCETVGVHDDFFELGGDSLLAAQMLVELHRETGRIVPETVLFEAATVRQLARSLGSNEAAATRPLVALRASGCRPPLIFLDGDFSGSGYYASRIAALLGPDQPFWLLRPLGLVEGQLPSIEAIAGEYLTLLKEADLNGPFAFGGYCNGALTALAMAHRAESTQDRVNLVLLIDPLSLNARVPIRLFARLFEGILRMVYRDPLRHRVRFEAAMSEAWKWIERIEGRECQTGRARLLFRRLIDHVVSQRWGAEKVAVPGDLAGDNRKLGTAYYRSMAGFLPSRIKSRIVCITPESHRRSLLFSSRVWKRFGSSFDAAFVPGEHLTCVTTHIESLAAQIRAALAKDENLLIRKEERTAVHT